jgi:hypothetical protein
LRPDKPQIGGLIERIGDLKLEITLDEILEILISGIIVFIFFLAFVLVHIRFISFSQSSPKATKPNEHEISVLEFLKILMTRNFRKQRFFNVEAGSFYSEENSLGNSETFNKKEEGTFKKHIITISFLALVYITGIYIRTLSFDLTQVIDHQKLSRWSEILINKGFENYFWNRNRIVRNFLYKGNPHYSASSLARALFQELSEKDPTPETRNARSTVQNLTPQEAKHVIPFAPQRLADAQHIWFPNYDFIKPYSRPLIVSRIADRTAPSIESYDSYQDDIDQLYYMSRTMAFTFGSTNNKELFEYSKLIDLMKVPLWVALFSVGLSGFCALYYFYSNTEKNWFMRVTRFLWFLTSWVLWAYTTWWICSLFFDYQTNEAHFFELWSKFVYTSTISFIFVITLKKLCSAFLQSLNLKIKYVSSQTHFYMLATISFLLLCLPIYGAQKKLFHSQILNEFATILWWKRVSDWDGNVHLDTHTKLPNPNETSEKRIPLQTFSHP